MKDAGSGSRVLVKGVDALAGLADLRGLPPASAPGRLSTAARTPIAATP